MKATTIHEFSNGGVVARLGTTNVYMIESTEELYAVWTLPPYDLPFSIRKDEVDWNESD